jgi:hypothetical protein
MKKSDQYHKWVEWSEEDQIYIGKCPGVITGIHEVEWPGIWERLGMPPEPNHAPKKLDLT